VICSVERVSPVTLSGAAVRPLGAVYALSRAGDVEDELARYEAT
jgi:hypothetical protein